LLIKYTQVFIDEVTSDYTIMHVQYSNGMHLTARVKASGENFKRLQT